MKFALRLLSASALTLACAWAQKGTTTAPPATGTTGTTNTPAVNTPPITPAPTTPPQTSTQPARPIYLSGKVVMDDGSPLPGMVDIQSVCGNRRRTVAHTTSSGEFGFQFNDNTGSVFEDASENGRPPGSLGSSSGASSSSGGGSAAAHMLDPLADCDLRVNMAGYTSSRVSLYDRSGLDNFDVGSIVLHRLTGDEGRVVSMLSLKAPKDAKKSFEKGTEQVKANKQEDAAQSFRKAVSIYPEYADAWLSLGRVESRLGSHEAARTDFQKARELDDKLVGPWEELGYFASDEAKWDEAARDLGQAVKLDPTGSPRAWYFYAMASYNLGNFEVAERSVRQEIKLDHGANPRSQFMLGMVLIARKDLPGGADALRTYIASGPSAQELETAKKQLNRVESQLGK